MDDAVLEVVVELPVVLAAVDTQLEVVRVLGAVELGEEGRGMKD